MNLSNLPIVLYLVSIPLISMGTTSGNEALTWLGFGALLIGGGITPGLRFGENSNPSPRGTRQNDQERKDG